MGGISWETSEAALREHFSNYGEVEDISLITDKRTGHGRGFGFVSFKEPDMANQALQDEHVILDRKVIFLFFITYTFCISDDSLICLLVQHYFADSFFFFIIYKFPNCHELMTPYRCSKLFVFINSPTDMDSRPSTILPNFLNFRKITVSAYLFCILFLKPWEF